MGETPKPPARPVVRTLGPREVSVAEALALGPALLARATEDRLLYVGASVVHGPAVLLGAAQRAGRVVRLDACVAMGTAVFRRATSGTAAYVGGCAIVWTLALPHVASLVADATPRTLINRNVRGFLQGFRRAGALAGYFGRACIVVQHRPTALLGFDVSERGAVLLEVIAGMDVPLMLPEALATDDERAVDRARGPLSLALGEVVRHDALHVAREVMETVASRATSPIELTAAMDVAPVPKVMRADDPMPPGFVARPGLRVPIGWIDTGIDPATGRVWLGGDVLAPRYLYAEIAEGRERRGDVALDGATLADLRRAAETTGV
jgi:hypothetical protein